MRADDYLRDIREIPGWFFTEDIQLFIKINELQEHIYGDIIEIGVYKGKSAILLGYFTKDRETMTVCDLFGTTAATEMERRENEVYYKDLALDTFEKHYQRFHSDLPVIFRCSSTDLADKVRPGTFRFVHVDGSHQYDIVRRDFATAKDLLVDGGVVVFDDYRSFHTPGVAAAVWQEIGTGHIRPFCVTPFKLYALKGPDIFNLFSNLKDWAESQSIYSVETDIIGGAEILRIRVRDTRTSIFKKLYWQLSSHVRDRHRAG